MSWRGAAAAIARGALLRLVCLDLASWPSRSQRPGAGTGATGKQLLAPKKR